MVALTGIEGAKGPSGPDQFGLSTCKHVDLVPGRRREGQYELAAWSAVQSQDCFDTRTLVSDKGKGSHGRLYLGQEFTTLKDIIADVDSKARIFQEEIFGPVLAITKAKDFEHALELANDSQYGLTGAVFSNSPEHLKQAKERFHVGDLYFNRKCTGTIVRAHPFGGFNMSGTDSKAGGPDYLLLFLQAKSVATKV